MEGSAHYEGRALDVFVRPIGKENRKQGLGDGVLPRRPGRAARHRPRHLRRQDLVRRAAAPRTAGATTHPATPRQAGLDRRRSSSTATTSTSTSSTDESSSGPPKCVFLRRRGAPRLISGRATLDGYPGSCCCCVPAIALCVQRPSSRKDRACVDSCAFPIAVVALVVGIRTVQSLARYRLDAIDLRSDASTDTGRSRGSCVVGAGGVRATCARRTSACARSLGSWASSPARSAASWAVTPARSWRVRAVDRRRPRPTGWRGDPSRRGWPRTCVLRREVQDRLERTTVPSRSPGGCVEDFPDDPEMWVSHETIYQSLYVQSRGGLQPRTGPAPAHRPDAAQAAPRATGERPRPDPGHGRRSANGPPRSRTGRCPGTGKAT